MRLSETKVGQLIFLSDYAYISYNPEEGQIIAYALMYNYSSILSIPCYRRFQTIKDFKRIIDKEFYDY